MSQYNGVVERAVDGDTLVVLANLGFDVYRCVRLRLRGVYAPERGTDDGERVFLYVRRLVAGKPCVIATHKIDRYGRYVADVWVDGKSVNELVKRAIARAERARASRERR